MGYLAYQYAWQKNLLRLKPSLQAKQVLKRKAQEVDAVSPAT
jgi:hypothetical protein